MAVTSVADAASVPIALKDVTPSVSRGDFIDPVPIDTDAGSVRNEVFALLWQSTPAADQPAPDNPEAAELVKERLAAERFLAVLEKNPRRGRSLEKVYAFHVDQGSLEAWIDTYRARVKQQPQDGIAWMLLGLIDMQRGQDAAAIHDFQNAEKHSPENALASYYLGQALITAGRSDLAAEALERSLTRNPASLDRLEIFQALGRVYQRTHQNEKALAVWNRLERLYPNDWRVQEQIAQTLVEEGELELALPRYVALAGAATQDLSRKSQFRIQVAELKRQLNQTKEALADFEKLLAELNPDNWLYRDVRQRIEAVYLRSEDHAGLAAYYEGWLKGHPEDVDAMARLARLLVGLGRGAESQAWLEKGLTLAPTRHELRKVIIDQLVYEQKYAAAIQQYEILNKQSPNNSETLREWGRLILKDATQPLTERQRVATALWKQLLIAKPQDPVVTTQVADLFRNAELAEEALTLYRLAIQLAPDAPQYREYLGEYYHQLKRPAEAMATWKEIAAGKNRTAANLSRLGEVLSGFGYMVESTAAFQQAIELDPQDFDLRLRLAKVLQRSEKYAEAFQQLAAAEKLATNSDEADIVLQQQLLVAADGGTLAEQIEALTRELAPSGANVSADQRDPLLAKKWYVLARYLEADHKPIGAIQAVQQALTLNPQSIAGLAALARNQEANRNLSAAVDTNRRLAAIDRRFRSEYLTRIARLEAKMGHVAAALAAGREVLAATSGNAESYDFYAQLCFQLGAPEDGLKTLRRAVRVNPSDTRVLLTLASKLAEQFKTSEAIEFYWRAFDKSADLNAQLDVVAQLTELYLVTNHFDQLVDRLEHRRRADPQQMRAETLCLAQAYQNAGDSSSARKELERLLTSDSRDATLLQQLARLAASEGDMQAAIHYQRQLTEVAPSREATMQLAAYLNQFGNTAAARQLIAQTMLAEKDPATILKNVDNLIVQGQIEQTLQVTKQFLSEHPQNWEFLYREGIALIDQDPAASEQRFRQLLALKLPESNLGLGEQARQKALAMRSPTASVQTLNDPTLPFFDRRHTAQVVSALTNPRDNGTVRFGTTGALGPTWSPPTISIRAAQFSVGQVPFGGFIVQGTPDAWIPATFGQARIAAFGWMLKVTQRLGRQGEFVDAVRHAWERSKSSEAAGWDWYTVRLLQYDNAVPDPRSTDLQDIVQELIKLPHASIETQVTYLHARAIPALIFRRREPPATPLIPNPQPETDHNAVVNEIVALYQRVRQHPGFKPIDETTHGVDLMLQMEVLLRSSNRHAEARKLSLDYIRSIESFEQIHNTLWREQSQGNMEAVSALWDRLDELQVAAVPGYQDVPAMYALGLIELIRSRAHSGEAADVLKFADRYLKSALRQQRTMGVAGGGRPTVPAGQAAAISSANGSAIRHVLQLQSGQYAARRRMPSAFHKEFDFPNVNPHYELETLVVLKAAYNSFKQHNQLEKLLDHFNKHANTEDVPLEDRLPWRLGLVYLHSWNDSAEKAAQLLSDICQTLPDDPDLRLQLAELYSMQQNWSKVLKEVDTISHVHQSIIRQRETLALRAAMALSNTERAKTAALYLSATLLDPQAQLQLASDMKSLGLSEQADQLASRTAHQPGTSISTLLTLMQHHAGNQGPELAAEIALTILRRTQSARLNANVQPNSPGDSLPGQARQAALQFLASSGKINELVKQAEAQLAKQPRSLQLNQTLIEYYRVAGNDTKVLATLDRLAEWDIGNPVTRWQLGQQQLASGYPRRAVAHFQAALKQQPELLPRMLAGLQHHQHAFILVEIFDNIDLRFAGNSREILRFVNLLTPQDNSRDTGLELFKRVWDAFPGERLQMVNSLHNVETGKSYAFYDYYRQALIPQAGNPPADRWAGFHVNGFFGNGIVTSSVDPLLISARGRNQLAELEQEVAQAVKAHPKWSAGPALLGIVQLQRDDKIAGLKTLQELLDHSDQPIPPETARIVAQRINGLPEGETLAIRYYELAIGNVRFGDPQRRSNEQFLLTPDYCLVELYIKRGDKEKARQLLRQALPGADESSGAPSRNSEDSENQYAIAAKLAEVGGVMEAMRVYHRLQSGPVIIRLNPSGDVEQVSLRRMEAIQEAVNGIGAEELIADLESTFQNLKDDATRVVPAVDLLLFTSPFYKGGLLLNDYRQPQSFRLPQLTSLAAKLFENLGQQADSYNAIAASLQKLQTARPDDVSILISQCLLSLKATDPRTFQQSAEELDRWVAAHSLEAVTGSDAERLTNVAEAQVALWLVARECLRRAALQPIGERLYRRACDAARAIKNHQYVLNIMDEAGAIAYAAGDKETAEARWTAELDFILSFPDRRRPPAETDAAAGPPIQLIGLDEFHLVCSLAGRAAAHGFPELSFKAARLAFHGGPPLPRHVASHNVPYTVNLTVARGYGAAEDAGILRTHLLLDQWQKADASPQDLYQSLLAIVVPDGRAHDVFVYRQPPPKPASEMDIVQLTSVGRLLVKQAVLANTVEHLKEKLVARSKIRDCEFPAQLLLAMLAVEAHDIPFAQQVLQKLTEMANKHQDHNSTALLCHAVMPALDQDELVLTVEPVIDRVFTYLNMVGSGSKNKQLSRILARTARQHYKLGHIAEGKRLLDRFQRVQEIKYDKYGQELVEFIHQRALYRVAEEFALAGQLPDALERLGKAVDLPRYPQFADSSDAHNALGVYRLLMTLAPEERYQQLNTWMLGNASRNAVRIMDNLGPEDGSPIAMTEELLKLLRVDPARRSQILRLLSPLEASNRLGSAKLLVQAAVDANMLDELEEQVRPLAKDKVGSARELLLLIELGRPERAAP